MQTTSAHREESSWWTEISSRIKYAGSYACAVQFLYKAFPVDRVVIHAINCGLKSGR